VNKAASEQEKACASEIIAYADESGTSANEKCYTIGALLVPGADNEGFKNDMALLAQRHGLVGEAKWNKVRSSHGQINFGIDVLKRIIQSDCCFSSIVVRKDSYRKWQSKKEDAFYTTYCLLLKHCADKQSKTVRVYIDERQDSYDKQDEVMEIVTNRMLTRLSSIGKIRAVSKADSRELICLQAADFLTGAINTAHHKYLNPDWEYSPGKALFIARMASILGWDGLVYDTYPNTDFNIWHFPEEYRADPQTRNVKANLSVSFVTPDELQQEISRAHKKR